ncbi:hypothetical protein HHI36_012836 [Cryptolaemus montrouzieri]|uniref:Uncharacterized protein n=1 Tax=Cryptolaemus montrouzieri TaxID=559131 RepID=A0ABD2NGG2_9CUCU
MPEINVITDQNGQDTPLDIANIFNEYFPTIGNKLAENIPPYNGMRFTEEIGSRSMFMGPTDIKEVEKVLKEMKKDCAPGSDNVTALDVLSTLHLFFFVVLYSSTK